MVSRLLQKFLIVLVLAISLSMPICANIFLDAAQIQIHKVTDKKPIHKSPIEFRQAVTRYIKNTDVNCLQVPQRNTDENVSYKKELRYLFKNYEKLSVVALLSRLRSAHQAMVKQDTNIDGEGYKKYEQICSALLLTCAQVFVGDVRNQILNVLHDIDNFIVYWRYQQNHQISYFFGKSPIKWIVGKNQEKEIIHNLIRLERKQSEFYTMLGALTGHLHVFTETGTTYEDCYAWIEQLFTIVASVKVEIHDSTTDGTNFDTLAVQLERKIKRVSKLKDDCMLSLKMAKKPSHFVRHWITYTIGAASIAYLIHYHVSSPEILPKALEKSQGAIKSVVQSVVVDPMTDLWRVFFGTHSEDSITNIEEKVEKIEKIAGIIEAKVNELTAADIQSLKEYSLALSNKVLARMKVANKDEIMEEISAGCLDKLSKLAEDTSIYYYNDKVDLGIANVLLMIDEVLTLLQKYPELIDEGILPLLQEIGFLFADVGKVTSNLLKNNFWTVKLAAFTPLAGACFGIHKTYQWSTTRDYSPIRIALADVNSLLIESAAHLDDYDYGKLVYLICKLRHKSVYLKDALSNEFLTDVAKLESKQYSAQTKRGIVENMFNKYAFLGRIAT
jgi:hypothetical protein